MTYRTLIRLLLCCATLVLAGVWWWSLTNTAFLTLAPRSFPHGLSVSLYPGTVAFVIAPSDMWGEPIDRGIIPVSSLSDELEESYGLTGRLRADTIEMGSYGLPGTFYRYLDLPLWALWIISAAGAWAVCRWLERRSGRTAEKALATRRKAENLVETPDDPEPPARP